MIRKPTADWQQRGEGAAVRTVRTAAAVATAGSKAAYRGAAVAAGLMCCAIAIFWGSLGLTSAGSLPEFIGNGAMVAFMIWVGRRLFAKARATD